MTSKQNLRVAAILAGRPELSFRDARDLAMEYGASGSEADRLAAGRK